MKSLASTKWGAHRNILKVFYISYIRSRIIYAIQVYSSASKSILSKLEVVQNSAIRIITGLKISIPIPVLQFESDMLPFEFLIKLFIMRYYYRISSLPSNHFLRVLFNDQKNIIDAISWERLSHKTSFQKRATNTCHELFLPTQHLDNNIQDLHRFIFPTWFDPKEFVNTLFVQMKKSNMGEEQVKQIFSFLAFNEFTHFVKIYSDGSKQQNGSVGAAIYVDDISATFSWRLEPVHSILTAELYAILQGILFAVNHLNNQNIVIFTDSLSALEIIQNPVNKGLNRLVNSI